MARLAMAGLTLGNSTCTEPFDDQQRIPCAVPTSSKPTIKMASAVTESSRKPNQRAAMLKLKKHATLRSMAVRAVDKKSAVTPNARIVARPF